jgi:hypothetical protein
MTWGVRQGLLLYRRISPRLRPSPQDVMNYDTPIREQQAAVTVRYTRADQQAAVAVEPRHLGKPRFHLGPSRSISISSSARVRRTRYGTDQA